MSSASGGKMSINWIKEANSDEETLKEVLSYEDYMDYFRQHAELQLRPSFEYLTDMLNYFGKDEKAGYKFFETKHDDAPAVYGQKTVQDAITQNLVNFQEEGFNNKFILLVGPNGSAKSSLVRKFMKGAEEYSKEPDGALYTFSWVFPIDSVVRGSLGLGGSKSKSTHVESYAYLEDKDISAILPSELKDHPILLIPTKYRQPIINDCLAKNTRLLDAVKKSYLYKGDLSKRNRMIYDALLKNAKGNHEEVLKHIRIERFFISRRYSNSAVTIEPQIHVDATLQQITMDRRLASLPPSLQSLNLFQLQGEVITANRGILEFSDLLKRPLDTYKYLLQTMETTNINLQGVLTELDIFFIGTSNEIHLSAFKQHPDFNSFKGRFNFIRVPYLLDIDQEERIYAEQIEGLKDRTTFEPLAMRVLCMFAVMSRLRCADSRNYQDKGLGRIVSEMNPLQKAMLYSKEMIMPEGTDSEGKQVLRQHLDEVMHEFELESLYEGKFGLSPRDMKKIIFDLASSYKNITFVEVLDYLKKLIIKKNDFDFLNMTPQGDFHHPGRFITLLQLHGIELTDREIRDALGLVDNRSYEDYIKRYVSNINALIKGEKIKNEITGQFVVCDEYFIQEFEKNIDLKEDPKKFRSHLISKLGAYYLDNRGKSIVYTDVFPDLIEDLKESFRNEQKKVMDTIARNVVYFEAELTSTDKRSNFPLAEKDREQIQTVITNMQKKYRYSQVGALTLLKFIIKERY
jgi:serine protein kinase